MIGGGAAACSADVLVEVAHLHIKLFAATIAHGQISSVLIKDFPIDGRGVSDIEEDLVLDGGKEALREGPGICGAVRGGNDGTGEVAEPACAYMFIVHQRASFCMVFGYVALLEPEPVGNGGGTCVTAKVSAMGIGQLLPGTMFGQIACNAAGYALLGYIGVADGAGKGGCEIEVDAGTKQQGVHLAPLVRGSELGVEIEAEF